MHQNKLNLPSMNSTRTLVQVMFSLLRQALLLVAKPKSFLLHQQHGLGADGNSDVNKSGMSKTKSTDEIITIYSIFKAFFEMRHIADSTDDKIFTSHVNFTHF